MFVRVGRDSNIKALTKMLNPGGTIRLKKMYLLLKQLGIRITIENRFGSAVPIFTTLYFITSSGSYSQIMMYYNISNSYFNGLSIKKTVRFQCQINICN